MWVNKILALRLAGLLCFAAGFILPVFFSAPWIVPALSAAAWLLTGGDVLFRAVRNILRGRIFDENFLMSIAAIGAFASGEFSEAAAVMIFYQTGEALQEAAVRRSRRSITALMDLRPGYAAVKRSGAILRVSPEEVRPGEFIVVKPGEKIPLDGLVEEGTTSLDTSALTGEPVPRRAQAGTEVLAGMVNQTALITVQVTREAGESAVSRILKLVKDAEEKKAPAEQFITRFARYYTPAVVFSAVALALLPPFFAALSGHPENAADFAARFSAPFMLWSKRALVFLVVSCPCALVVSIPLSFFGGIGGASRRGILVKGGSHLDTLTRTGTVVFDKTGTLTKGTFSVSAIIPRPDFTQTGVLRLAALAESNSSHPIARSIQKAAAAQNLITEAPVRSFSENAGKGVQLHLEDGRIILAGSRSMLEEKGVHIVEEGGSLPPGLQPPVSGAPPSAGQRHPPFRPAAPRLSPGTIVYLAVDGQYAGQLVIADEIKPDSAWTVAELNKAGIRTVMLSGDSAEAAGTAALEIGITEVYAGLLPWEKVTKLEELKKECRLSKQNKVLFVGDGINDAPVLAASDAGIAMGGLGSDAAIESADIVLMTDEPSRLIEALKTAAKTAAVVKQNIVFALGVKAALLVLGAAGIASLWMAVFGDVGVALLAVANACRTMRIPPLNRESTF